MPIILFAAMFFAGEGFGIIRMALFRPVLFLMKLTTGDWGLVKKGVSQQEMKV